MHNIILCVVIVLLLLVIVPQMMTCSDSGDFKDPSLIGYATNAPAAPTSQSQSDYNDYLQTVALEPAIKEQHSEWTDNLMINYQPRMLSIRDDCDDGETKRWGLLKKDYSNVINEHQNISIPSGRTCTEGDGGSSRWGGYGIGLHPVQLP